MSAQKGSLVLIKVGDGAGTETFTTIGGLLASSLLLGHHALDATNLESGVWQQLLGNAGTLSLKITGNGIFTDAAAEEMVRGYAFAGTVNNYRFVFANGDYVAGSFMVTAYERSGHYDSEEIYSLTLESSGTISFTSL